MTAAKQLKGVMNRYCNHHEYIVSSFFGVMVDLSGNFPSIIKIDANYRSKITQTKPKIQNHRAIHVLFASFNFDSYIQT